MKVLLVFFVILAALALFQALRFNNAKRNLLPTPKVLEAVTVFSKPRALEKTVDATTLIGYPLYHAFPNNSNINNGTTAYNNQQVVVSSQYKPTWLVVSELHNVAITVVPKVMCTSIRSVLNWENCVAASGKHGKRCAEARRNPKWRNDLPTKLHNKTCVLVVRDPIERALSAYHNSAINPHIQNGKYNSSQSCTFEEWVDELYNNKNNNNNDAGGDSGIHSNEHFIPQARVAQLGQMHYHYILRLSSPIDMQFFWGTLLNQTSIPVINQSNNNKTTTITSTEDDGHDHDQHSKPSPFHRISSATLKKLKTLYSADFDLWEKLLQEGTPKVAGEMTTYDYYRSTLLYSTALDTTTKQNVYPLYHSPPNNNRRVGPKYNPFWLVVSQTHNLAITIIPKVMCSSIRGAINSEECSSSSHRHKRCAEVRTLARKRRILRQIHKKTRVLIVRDPIDRALSAYHNSAINPHIWNGKYNSSLYCTFEEWVEELYNNTNNDNAGGIQSNEHFLPQTQVAQFDQMHYHYILRLSSPTDMQFFWGTLLNRTDIPVVNQSNKNKTTTSTSGKDGGHHQHQQEKYHSISSATLNQLKALYSADFDLWEKLLQEGTPKVAGEMTTYDNYRSQLLDSTAQA